MGIDYMRDRTSTHCPDCSRSGKGTDGGLCKTCKGTGDVINYAALPESPNIRVTHYRMKKKDKWQQYYLKVTGGQKPIPCSCNPNGKKKEVDFPTNPRCSKSGQCGGKRFEQKCRVMPIEMDRDEHDNLIQDSFTINLDETSVPKLLSASGKLDKLTFEFIPYQMKTNKKTKNIIRDVKYNNAGKVTARVYG